MKKNIVTQMDLAGFVTIGHHKAGLHDIKLALNGLVAAIEELATEQATRELSGTDWAKNFLADLKEVKNQIRELP